MENNPGWLMTGGSARHVKMDSIVVKLQNISSTYQIWNILGQRLLKQASLKYNHDAFENMIGIMSQSNIQS